MRRRYSTTARAVLDIVAPLALYRGEVEPEQARMQATVVDVMGEQQRDQAGNSDTSEAK
jgi:hypothetical protein